MTAPALAAGFSAHPGTHVSTHLCPPLAGAAPLVGLVPSFLELLEAFRGQMTGPTFASLLTVLGGWLFARRRTVTGALAAGLDLQGLKGLAGPGELAESPRLDKHFSSYHRLLSLAKWSPDEVGLALLGLVLLLAFATGATVFLAVDDTLCRRKGRKVWGAGMHYDPLLTGRKWSNAGKSVKSRGHSWVVLGVVLAFGFRPGHYYCLPVLSRLCLNKKTAARLRRAYRSRPQLARELVALVCSHFPSRRFHLLCDSAYAGQDTLRSLPNNCHMTARWILNASLCALPQPKEPGKKGPQRKRGEALPKPSQMLDERCRREELDVFGLRLSLRVADRLACLYTVPGKLLRVIATEPLTEGGHPRPKYRAAFFSTDTSADVLQVLAWYATRWSIEITFKDAKQELGLAQPQGWTEKSATARLSSPKSRSAPLLFLLYSLVVLWFSRAGHALFRPTPRPWYASKAHATFADMLHALRAECLRHLLAPAHAARAAAKAARAALAAADAAAAPPATATAAATCPAACAAAVAPAHAAPPAAPEPFSPDPTPHQGAHNYLQILDTVLRLLV
jgi:hypothetical protein